MGARLTADEDLDGSFEMWYRGRRTAKGEDFARGERLLGRFGEIKDGRVEETWIEKGFFVAGGVRPREVPAGKMSES